MQTEGGSGLTKADLIGLPANPLHRTYMLSSSQSIAGEAKQKKCVQTLLLCMSVSGSVLVQGIHSRLSPPYSLPAGRSFSNLQPSCLPCLDASNRCSRVCLVLSLAHLLHVSILT